MIRTKSVRPAFDAEFVSLRVSMAVDFSKPCIKFCRDAAIELNNLGHNYPKSGIMRYLYGDKGFYVRPYSNQKEVCGIPLSALPPHLVRKNLPDLSERNLWHLVDDRPQKFDLLSMTYLASLNHCPSSRFFDWKFSYEGRIFPFPTTPYIKRLTLIVFPIGIKPDKRSCRERRRDALCHANYEIEKARFTMKSPITFFVGVGDGTDKDVEQTLSANDIYLSSFSRPIVSAYKPKSKDRKAFAEQLLRVIC